MPNDLWNIQVSRPRGGRGFNPAVGFVTRRGYRRYQPFVEYGPRPRNSTIVRRYAFSTGVDVQTDMANDLLTRAVDLKVFDVNFHSQDAFSATVSNRYERLDEPFTISPGITLPKAPSTRSTVSRSGRRPRTAASLPSARRSKRAASIPAPSRVRRSTSPSARARAHRLRVDRTERRGSARRCVHHAALSAGRRNAVQPVDRAGQQLPVRLGERACLAGNRASAGSSGRAATSTSSTLTTTVESGSSRIA